MVKSIVSDTHGIEIYITVPVYKEVKQIKVIKGKRKTIYNKVFDKNVYLKKWIKKDAITSIEEYISEKGVISKNKSIIYDKFSNRFFQATHGVDEMLTALRGTTFSVGFNK